MSFFSHRSTEPPPNLKNQVTIRVYFHPRSYFSSTSPTDSVKFYLRKLEIAKVHQTRKISSEDGFAAASA
jgi:hypothetical protein